MCSEAVRANCLDASALVKLYVEEKGSDILKKYFEKEATWYTTPICFYEALNVLKRKWLKCNMTREEYMAASFKMAAQFSCSSQIIPDVDFLSPSVFKDVQEIAKKHDLDLSDSFQIVSVKYGYFSRLAGDSKTVLVTADKALADAARKECILSWYIFNEPPQ